VAAQVLAFHRLEVIDARVDLRPPGGMRAIMTVSTGFGDPVDPRLLAQDLKRAVDSGLPASMRHALARTSSHTRPADGARVSALVSPRSDGPGVLLEVRAQDRPGLLATIVSALLGADAKIDWVLVRTRGSAVEDVFALSGPGAALRTAAVVESALSG
jgi:[protein-PII] uridylyltransferase